MWVGTALAVSTAASRTAENTAAQSLKTVTGLAITAQQARADETLSLIRRGDEDVRKQSYYQRVDSMHSQLTGYLSRDNAIATSWPTPTNCWASGARPTNASTTTSGSVTTRRRRRSRSAPGRTIRPPPSTSSMTLCRKGSPKAAGNCATISSRPAGCCPAPPWVGRCCPGGRGGGGGNGIVAADERVPVMSACAKNREP